MYSLYRSFTPIPFSLIVGDHERIAITACPRSLRIFGLSLSPVVCLDSFLIWIADRACREYKADGADVLLRPLFPLGSKPHISMQR